MLNRIILTIKINRRGWRERGREKENCQPSHNLTPLEFSGHCFKQHRNSLELQRETRGLYQFVVCSMLCALSSWQPRLPDKRARAEVRRSESGVSKQTGD